jgi:Tol biopolymer transport system component
VETGEERELSPKMSLLGYNLRWSPDARSVLVRGYDTQNRVGVYTISLQTGEVMASMPEAYWADWCCDGKAIIYAMNDAKRNLRPLVVRDLETGQDKELLSCNAGLGLAVSRDGRWVAFSALEPDAEKGWTATLKIMPATGGEARDLLRLKRPEDFGSIAWTPDGHQLFFVRRYMKNEDTFSLWRIRAEGGEPQRIGVAMGDTSQISVHPDGRRIAFNAGDSKTEVWMMENFLPALKAAR